MISVSHDSEVFIISSHDHDDDQFLLVSTAFVTFNLFHILHMNISKLKHILGRAFVTFNLSYLMYEHK